MRCSSRSVTVSPMRRVRGRSPIAPLGLVTLLPAWLVAFVGLLGTTPGVRPQLVSGAAWLLSAAAGLIGAIATEARVRETGDFAEAHQATRLWRLGVLAFLPAWVIVLSGHVV